jgi:hypothetical protein
MSETALDIAQNDNLLAISALHDIPSEGDILSIFFFFQFEKHRLDGRVSPSF